MAATDWSVLEIEGVSDEITRQAASVAASFETFHSAEDLEQEAMIHCAMNPAWVKKCTDVSNRYFGTAMWRVLRDKVYTEAVHQGNSIGLHRLHEKGE